MEGKNGYSGYYLVGGGLIYSLLEQMLKRKRCFKLGVAELGNPSI